MTQFPPSIQDFANMFVQMQEKRHRADYDPTDFHYKSSVQAETYLSSPTFIPILFARPPQPEYAGKPSRALRS